MHSNTDKLRLVTMLVALCGNAAVPDETDPFRRFLRGISEMEKEALPNEAFGARDADALAKRQLEFFETFSRAEIEQVCRDAATFERYGEYVRALAGDAHLFAVGNETLKNGGMLIVEVGTVEVKLDASRN